MRTLLAHAWGLPPVTKAAGAACAALSVAAYVLRSRAAWPGPGDPVAEAGADPARFLVLRAGHVTRYPWTVATGPLTEPSPLLLACALAALATVGSFLERHWGGRSYAAFLAVVAAVPAAAAAVATIALYAVRRNAEFLYATPIGGLAGVAAGFTVGLKQLVPEHRVKLLRGAVGFRVNDLPGLYTLVVPVLFTLLGNLGAVLLADIGFVVSFVYLRFYKRTGPVKGDRSDAFAFCTLFPPFAQPVVARLADGVYNLAVAARLITSDEGYRQAVDMEAGVGLRGPAAEPPAEASDADRRRALAAKAVDVRLASESPAPSSSAAATATATASPPAPAAMAPPDGSADAPRDGPGGPDPSALLPGQLLVGPPHPVSNIRPVRFYVPPDESPAERRYRELREDAVRQDHRFWLDNNSRFEQGKAEARSACPVDGLAAYYKQYQDDAYRRHLAYNRYVWRRSFAMLWPAVRAWITGLGKRRRRTLAAAATHSAQAYFDRGPAATDRRAEKIKSYY
ncbi:hypothetical protein H4R18_001125 [Coemansia javaensis]|uniref:Uncharacterized protein n=1 Tax=Coemansia javaensis TaxID=2761396 RepID=A0A9W8HFZ6_9FUNG|nr:hypothetical protein H4R18_001125 [Coemansia javaensis]